MPRRTSFVRLAPAAALFVLLLVAGCCFDIPLHNGTGGEDDTTMAVAPGELVLAVVIMRHGDRAPQNVAPAYSAGDRASRVERFPIDSSHWEVDFGQLTSLGLAQTRAIGRRLRSLYVVSKSGKSRNFLSKNYLHVETHVRSTDVDRTLVSAMNVMVGLYEEGNEVASADKKQKESQRSEPEANSVVVPVHTVEYSRDALMDASSKAHCPTFFNAGQRMLDTPFCRGAIMRNTELLDALPALTGRDTSRLSFPQLVDLLAALRDLRVAQRAHNVPQPKNVTRFDAALDDIVARIGIAKWDVPGLGGLVGGRLLRAIGTRITSMIGLLRGDVDVVLRSREECNAMGSDSDEDGACPRKLVVYVGHDTTIFDVRSAIGLHAVDSGEEGGGVAPYASHLIFELRRKKRKKHRQSAAADVDASDYQYTVTVLSGSHSTPTDTVAGPFCGGKATCSVDAFLAYVRARVPPDVDAACGVSDAPPGRASGEGRRRGGGALRAGWFGGFSGVMAAATGTMLGLTAGYIAGSTAHRTRYEAIAAPR